MAIAVFASGGYIAWIAFVSNTLDPRALGPGEVHRIRLNGPPQPTAAGEGAAWTAVGTTENEDLLWRVDAVTEKPQVLPNTKGADWPAVGEGFAWVTCLGKDNPCSGPSVLKLDPRSGETLATISLPEQGFGITAGLGAVWVAMYEGLAKLDPVEGRVTDVFPGNYSSVGTAGGSVWAKSYDPDRVYRINPSTGAVVDTIALRNPCTFEASNGVVWVVTCDAGEVSQDEKETLTKIDAKTAEIVFQAPLERYGQMRVVGESLWLASRPNDAYAVIEVVRLDPESGRVAAKPIRIATGEIRFFSHGPGQPHVFVAADDRSLWLTDFRAGDVIRLGLPSVGQVAPSEPTVAPTPPADVTPAPGTGVQRIPETLKMDAEVRADSIIVTNRNAFDWSECDVQLNTRLNELDPFEHPIVPMVRSEESVVLPINRFERHAMTSERLSVETFERFPWKRLVLVCETPVGSGSGQVEWGSSPGPPDGPGALIGVSYPFDLYTHCGVVSARFDGRDWNADPPLFTSYGGNPPSGWGNPIDRGTMTLLEPDLAEFRSNAGHVARFRPRPAGEPDPAGGCL